MCTVAAGILRRPRGRSALAALLLAVSSGCVWQQETTISRLAREREMGAATARHENQRRELTRLEQEGAAGAVAVAAAKAESVRRSAELRAVLTDLRHQLTLLQAAEQDLEATRERALAIEQQLAPLRALEQTLLDQDRLRVEASQRVTALQAEVAAATASVEQKENELRPRLLVLLQQLAAAQQLEHVVAKAQGAVAEAIKVLSPPPAPPAPPEQKK